MCSALGVRDAGPEARAVRLSRWRSTHGDHIPPSESAAPPGPYDSLTLRSIVEHRAYFQADCGSKAPLLISPVEPPGLKARQRRLCGSRHTTPHVVCEVQVSSPLVVFHPTLGL